MIKLSRSHRARVKLRIKFSDSTWRNCMISQHVVTEVKQYWHCWPVTCTYLYSHRGQFLCIQYCYLLITNHVSCKALSPLLAKCLPWCNDRLYVPARLSYWWQNLLISDHELKTIIDKLANFVARNGPEFEHMTKQKQKDNPKFSFLFGGEHFNYYQYKVTTEQASK